MAAPEAAPGSLQLLTASRQHKTRLSVSLRHLTRRYSTAWTDMQCRTGARITPAVDNKQAAQAKLVSQLAMLDAVLQEMRVHQMKHCCCQRRQGRLP